MANLPIRAGAEIFIIRKTGVDTRACWSKAQGTGRSPVFIRLFLKTMGDILEIYVLGGVRGFYGWTFKVI